MNNPTPNPKLAQLAYISLPEVPHGTLKAVNRACTEWLRKRALLAQVNFNLQPINQ